MVEAKSWAPGSHLEPSWANLSPADRQLGIGTEERAMVAIPMDLLSGAQGMLFTPHVSTPSILPRAFPWQRESPWKGVGGGGLS